MGPGVGFLVGVERLVEGGEEGGLVLAEAEGAVAADRVAVDHRLGEGGGGLDGLAVAGEAGDGEAGRGIGGDATIGHGGKRVGVGAEIDDLAVMDADGVGEAEFISAGNDSEFRVAVFKEPVIAMDAERVAGLDQQALAIARIDRREGHLGAARRQDVLFGGHHVEPAGLEAGDQRAEGGDDPLLAVDADFAENVLRDVGADAVGLAVGVHVAIWNLVGDGDADEAAAADVLEHGRRLGLAAEGYGGHAGAEQGERAAPSC